MTPGRRIAIAVCGLGVAVVGAAFFTRPAPAAKEPAAGAPADRAVPVATATVMKKDVPVILEGLGTVTSLATITVRSLVDGRLDQIFFQEGAEVKKGEVLAQVDPRPFAIQLQQGEAALARDAANLANAEVNLKRYEELRERKLGPQNQVDDQRATVAQLKATTMADDATIKNARLMLDYARITSPINGVVGVRLIDRGNIVHPGDTTGIVIVTQLDPISVLFTLPQDDLPRVQKALGLGKPAVEAWARNGNDRLGIGQLDSIDNLVNASTATIRMKASFSNADKRLWPNQFVKARLHVDTLKGVTVVPAPAIQRGPQGAFVYVVAPDRSVSMRPVEGIDIERDDAVVAKGLTPGEVVVTDGQNLLRPGAKVAPRAPAGAAPSAAPSAAPR